MLTDGLRDGIVTLESCCVLRLVCFLIWTIWIGLTEAWLIDPHLLIIRRVFSCRIYGSSIWTWWLLCTFLEFFHATVASTLQIFLVWWFEFGVSPSFLLIITVRLTFRLLFPIIGVISLSKPIFLAFLNIICMSVVTTYLLLATLPTDSESIHPNQFKLSDLILIDTKSFWIVDSSQQPCCPLTWDIQGLPVVYRIRLAMCSLWVRMHISPRMPVLFQVDSRIRFWNLILLVGTLWFLRTWRWWVAGIIFIDICLNNNIEALMEVFSYCRIIIIVSIRVDCDYSILLWICLQYFRLVWRIIFGLHLNIALIGFYTGTIVGFLI